MVFDLQFARLFFSVVRTSWTSWALVHRVTKRAFAGGATLDAAGRRAIPFCWGRNEDQRLPGKTIDVVMPLLSLRFTRTAPPC